ncbi:MAG: type II secretion system minor pseudopilin GspK, partial [Pseudomonadales bacterium]|nr:type II secretion system minor pseudopilin GspK [Pseudomonadales bacterium]
ITVMLLFAIGAYMATEITYRQRVDILRSGSLFDKAQAIEYVYGAEEIAKFALRRDLKKDKEKNKNSLKDHAQEDWGMPLSQAVDGGTIEGQLSDLQGRFNLNWLMETDPDKKAKVKSALLKLLAELKIPKETPAQEVVDQLVDLMDDDSTPTFPDGKEESEYMLEELPRRAGNRLLVDLSELLLIPALTPEEVEILAPFVAVLPPTSAINLQAAPSEVLNSFDCLDVSSIVGGEPRTTYEDLKDLTVFKTDDDCKTAENDFPIAYGISSEFFELSAKSVMNGKTVKVRSVLYRNSEQDSNIDVKVIYRKQVDPFSSV